MASDLAGAIAERYAEHAADLAAFTDFYDNQPGEPPTLPYLVFWMRRARTALITSDGRYADQRVRFTAYAASQGEANALREAVRAAFGAGPYDWDGGFSIPFSEEDAFEGKLPTKTALNQYQYAATVEYSARTRRT